MNQNDLMQYWYAYTYDQEIHQDDVEHIISMVGNSPLNILEVACGSGRISIPLAQIGHTIQAQELFIQKAASCVKQGGHLYLDFTCANWPDIEPSEANERVIFEGTDDIGTYGRFMLAGGGEYSSKTRIDKSYRRYEITPKNGEMFSVTKKNFKHFPTHEQVASWIEKYGWDIGISKETFHAIIWARKKIEVWL